MFEKFFKFEENNTDFKTELLAGFTTFLAMAFILGINPTMISEAGLSLESIFFATALTSGIASILMGLISNYPVGIAPGLSINALFTYNVIISMGNSWQAALSAVFIASILYLVITLSGIQGKILNATPNDLKLAISAAIGFFLAFIGLKSSGLIIADSTTLVSMGSILNPSVLLAVIGIFITLILYVQKIPAAIFIGLLSTSFIGIVFTFLGYGVGNVAMPTIPSTVIDLNVDTSLLFGFLYGFDELFSNIPNLIMILFSILFIKLFDSIAVLMFFAQECGFVNENGKIKGIEKAFFGDAISGIIGSLLGSSTLAPYIESAIGIEIGGRTGLAAIITGLLFLLSIFFSPLILSLFTPPVTTSALVIIGILMIMQLKDIEWNNLIIVSSTFMTILMMLLTSSISLGIAWGFIVYAICCIALRETKEFNWITWSMLIIFMIYLFFGL